MGKIAKAMPGWLKYSSGTTGKDALKYIESGDPGAFARIKPSSRTWEYWPHQLRGVMADPGAMGDEDRRALHALAAVEAFNQIGAWLSQALGRAKGEENLHDVVREELATVKLTTPTMSALTVTYVDHLARGGHPNSAGRYLLGLSDRDLKAAVKKAASMREDQGDSSYPRLAGFLLETAPERLGPLLDLMLEPKAISPETCETILARGADRYETAVAAAWRAANDLDSRFEIGRVMARHSPDRYARETLGIAQTLLADATERRCHDDVGVWMIQQFGAEALGDIVVYLRRAAKSKEWADQLNLRTVTSAAVQALGPQAVPAVLEALGAWDADAHHQALSHLIEIGGDAHIDRIRTELARGMAESEELKSPGWRSSPAETLIPYINLAARSQPAAMADRFWELLGHKAKAVRDAAARALGRMGPEVVPRAAGLLEDRKAANRAAAVVVLATAGTSEALDALERRLDEESDEDIRDSMLIAVDAARTASGREVGREEIARRIERTAPKLKAPVAAWLTESRLPPLRDRDGDALGPEAIRYLLYRQSRAREIRPDVEAQPLFARIDRATSGEFAQEVLRQFAASKAEARDRWALAIAGLLGDDRVVPTLSTLIGTWADSSRGKMAEYAVQALALLGTDAALMCVDSVAIRYRSKNKNIGTAASEAFAATAERLGLTPDELGDRVVPWLGFELGQPRVLEAGGKRLEATVGPDFKLKYRDPEKGKAIATLPKSLPKETLAEFKDLGATLREVAKAQKLRLETLMVRQFRWPVARWRELFLNHPVLFLPFATRLVWGHYDDSGRLSGTFRALEDRTLTDAADEPFDLPDTGTIGIVHPLELADEALQAWRTHIADYEVEPPFAQLERPIVRVNEAQRDLKIARELSGTNLNAMTFRGRAEKLGWTRGSVTDGGGVDSYRKVFPGAGAEAFLGVDGLYIGIGMDDSVQLGEFYFVKAGAVDVGSYTYDNPHDEGDSRLIPFGDVPPVVYSEVRSDLKRIVGQSSEEEVPAEEG